jgi:hypothetical protein
MAGCAVAWRQDGRPQYLPGRHVSRVVKRPVHRIAIPSRGRSVSTTGDDGSEKSEILAKEVTAGSFVTHEAIRSSALYEREPAQ